MQDTDKTQEQLIAELAQLRRQITDLEASETGRRRVERDLKESLEQIEQAKQEWEVTADSLPQLICLLDNTGRIIRTNRTIENWGLAQVVNVKGKKVEELFYSDTGGYLKTFLEQAWGELAQYRSSQIEVKDDILKRHFHIQVQPISTETGRKSKATDSFAALILHDITERKQAERLKNEFLANISQELQTPLTSIIGYSQIMLTGMEGELDPEVLENIQAIHENSRELSTLINRILDLAEIETGNLVLTLEEVSVEQRLDKVKTNYTSLLVDKPIDISVETQPDLPRIKVDKMRLDQILDHLVSNAVKFTNEGGINLRAFRQNGWLYIEVKDAGIGIDEDNLEIIFEKFRQVDGSLSRHAQGAGLGLAITRHLIQLHGGAIDVQSRLGRGTTVTIKLPIKP